MKTKNSKPAGEATKRKPITFRVATKGVKIEKSGKPAAAPAPPAGN